MGVWRDDPEPTPLAVRANTTDPVELWLIRLRPRARARYLRTLDAFLEHAGHNVGTAIEAARADRHAVHEVVKMFIRKLPDTWTERAFAYAALRSFFSRCRIDLPTDPGYAVGGHEERWWLRSEP